MSDNEFDVMPVAGHRLAVLTDRAEGIEAIGPMVGPLFGRLAGMLAAAGSPPDDDPSVAVYTVSDDGGVAVTVGFPYDGSGIDGNGFDDVRVIDLPAVEHAARTVYRGSMAGIRDAWQQLMRQAEADGWVLDGPAREVYLSTPLDDPDAWVTELQQPVRRAAGSRAAGSRA